MKAVRKQATLWLWAWLMIASQSSIFIIGPLLTTHVGCDDGVNCAGERGAKVELDVGLRLAVGLGSVAKQDGKEDLQQSTAIKESGVRMCETRRGGAREPKRNRRGGEGKYIN